MTPRIGVGQHGDVREARRLRAVGLPEPYYGMHYSQGFLDRWMAGRPHLVISLDGPPYRERQGNGLLLGLPAPTSPLRLPGTIQHLWWARRIARELRIFRPTHFLLRTGSLLAAVLLRTAGLPGAGGGPGAGGRVPWAGWQRRGLSADGCRDAGVRPHAARVPGGVPADAHRGADRPHAGPGQRPPGVHAGPARRRGPSL